jgi:hypothetical protein
MLPIRAMAALVLPAALLLGGAPGRTQPSTEGEDLIQRLCLAGFQRAFEQAGERPPVGMGAFTCRCLVQRIQDGQGLSPAREQCTTEASRRFRVVTKG